MLIYSSGLKVLGEGEWKVRTHGADRRRTWRKLRVSVDAAIHQIAAPLITDNKRPDRKALPVLLDRTEGKVEKVCTGGAYEVKACYDNKQALAVIPPKSGTGKLALSR